MKKIWKNLTDPEHEMSNWAALIFAFIGGGALMLLIYLIFS